MKCHNVCYLRGVVNVDVRSRASNSWSRADAAGSSDGVVVVSLVEGVSLDDVGAGNESDEDGTEQSKRV